MLAVGPLFTLVALVVVAVPPVLSGHSTRKETIDEAVVPFTATLIDGVSNA